MNGIRVKRNLFFFRALWIFFNICPLLFLDDYRLFCGDLGNEVSDEMLTRAFDKYVKFGCKGEKIVYLILIIHNTF